MYPYESYYYPQALADFNPYIPQDQYDFGRQQASQFFQLPQWREIQRRLNQVERQNERQQREIDQLQRRLQRVNQRLRAVENRLQIPFTAMDGEF
jgi:septal ring factor EnvC (AmiA/AmiB activator)